MILVGNRVLVGMVKLISVHTELYITVFSSHWIMLSVHTDDIASILLRVTEMQTWKTPWWQRWTFRWGYKPRGLVKCQKSWTVQNYERKKYWFNPVIQWDFVTAAAGRPKINVLLRCLTHIGLYAQGMFLFNSWPQPNQSTPP